MAKVYHNDILVITPKAGHEYLFALYNGFTARSGLRVIYPSLDGDGKYILGAGILQDPEFNFNVDVNGTPLIELLDTIPLCVETEDEQPL
jgi:hypothetical protein